MKLEAVFAYEHLEDARRALDVALVYLTKQPAMQDRIDEMRSEISRLMHELETPE